MKRSEDRGICGVKDRYPISREANLVRSMAILLFLMVLTISAPTLSAAEDIYVAQNAAGNNDGSSCSDAHSASWFNTAGNWGSGAGKISAGDTVHLCGTITSELTAQGSGSSGSSITIYFETGAKIQPATFCSPNGCLNVANKSYIVVDGGTPCGYINRLDTPCNGIIQNTTAIPPSTSFGIQADSCNNCEFKNLQIGPLFIPDGVNDCGGDNRGIQNLTGTTSGATWKVHHNVIRNTGSGVVYVPVGTNDNGLQVYNNYEYNNNSHVDISNNNNGNLTAASIHDNHFGSTAVMDLPGCPAHHNSLHAFAKTTYNSGIDFYNNLIDGEWGGCATSGLFIEGGEYGANRNVRVFNNVWAITNYTQMNNGIVNISGDGPMEFYNNIIISPGTGEATCLAIAYSNSVKVENNIITGDCTQVAIGSNGGAAPTIITWDYNIYAGATGNLWTDQSIPAWYNTLSAWSSHCSCDSHSLYNLSPTYVKVNSDGSLQPGSPAIDIGVNLSSLGITALNSDRWGASRPQGLGWDIGAYEFVNSGPLPPSNLRIVQ